MNYNVFVARVNGLLYRMGEFKNKAIEIKCVLADIFEALTFGRVNEARQLAKEIVKYGIPFQTIEDIRATFKVFIPESEPYLEDSEQDKINICDTIRKNISIEKEKKNRIKELLEKVFCLDTIKETNKVKRFILELKEYNILLGSRIEIKNLIIEHNIENNKSDWKEYDILIETAKQIERKERKEKINQYRSNVEEKIQKIQFEMNEAANKVFIVKKEE